MESLLPLSTRPRSCSTCISLAKTEQWWQRLKSEVGHWKETDTKLEAAKAKKLEAEKENPQKFCSAKNLAGRLGETR